MQITRFTATRQDLWRISLSVATLLLCLTTITPAQALRPSHEADRLLMAAEQAFDAGNTQQAADHLNRASRLGIALPPEYDFLYGKLLQQQGKQAEARLRLERYVDSQGREAKHYREALNLITQLENKSRSAPAPKTVDKTSEIAWSDTTAEYIRKIEKLYGTTDTTRALTQHVNSLLKFYAYGDERIRAASNMGTPSSHRISTSPSGEFISMNRYGDPAQAPTAEDKFSVYGVNPYIDYRCSDASRNCWLFHPVTAERWLQIVQNEDAAMEIVKAIASLIRQMQKTS